MEYRDSITTPDEQELRVGCSLKEGFFGIGNVQIKTFSLDEKNQKENVMFRNNLIVKPGRSLLINWLSGSPETRKIEKFVWGSGGASATDVFVPGIVDDDGTGISSASKILTETSLPSGYPQKLTATNSVVSGSAAPYKLKYVFLLTSTDARLTYPASNIIQVNEATLLLTDDSVFAHVKFPTISLNKNFGTGIELTWVIDFSNQSS